MHDYAVYIMASAKNGTLYIGVTSNLVQRVAQHKQGTFRGFSKKYAVTMLVWFQMTGQIAGAIQREKQLKKWNRLWKLRLIEETNPHWRDLYADFFS